MNTYSLGTRRSCYFQMDYFSGMTLQFFIGTKDLIRTCQELLGSAKITFHLQMEMAINHFKDGHDSRLNFFQFNFLLSSSLPGTCLLVSTSQYNLSLSMVLNSSFCLLSYVESLLFSYATIISSQLCQTFEGSVSFNLFLYIIFSRVLLPLDLSCNLCLQKLFGIPIVTIFFQGSWWQPQVASYGQRLHYWGFILAF